jgi:hypothetical protein
MLLERLLDPAGRTEDSGRGNQRQKSHDFTTSVLRHQFSEKGSGSPSGGDIRNTSRIMEIMT